MEISNMSKSPWKSIREKSRGDRIFFDNFVLLVWCECKAGATTKSKTYDEWADILLPCYSAGQNAIEDKDCGMYFNTPRNKMSASELEAVQQYISSNTFYSVTDAKEKMKRTFGDCMTTALNIL